MLRPTLFGILVCSLVGCGGEGAAARSQSFEETFDLVRRVVLEEPDSAPLTGIRNFAPAGDGGFLVVDRGRPQVRLFDSDGTLRRIVGRFGGGPGEFRQPTDAVVGPRGALYVAEADGATVTRFRAGTFEFDTIFKLPGMVTYDLDWAADYLLAVLWNEPAPPNNHYASVLTRAGDPVAALHPVDSLVWAVPYWSSFAGPVAAAGATRIVTGNNFIYPLRLYDQNGRHLKDFGSPPQSWQPLGHPERGAFIGPAGRDRLDEWLTSAMMVSRVGVYRDSAIVVVHARPRPEGTDFHARRDTLVDVYRLDGTKKLEDVPVPGRVLRVEDFLYILEASPPAPWTVGIYRFR